MHRLLVLVSVCLLVAVAVVRPAEAQSNRLCFDVPGITNCIEGRFREYWEQNGGLQVFGYPITRATEESNRDTGQVYLTQWFERNRFELHPENARPYDVLLGRLGDDMLLQTGRRWQRLAKSDPSAAHFFAETGHAIANAAFWGYWSTHGLEFDGRRGTSFAESLALFGYPISEPAMEQNPNGDTVLTQWFERARFEWHPNKPAAFQVLLGLVGAEARNTGCVPIIEPLRRHYEEGGASGANPLTYQERLGCALGASHEISAAEQFFEQGVMLWHVSPYPRTAATIYVGFTGSIPVRAARYPDLWAEGEPETAGLTPPEGRYEPKRGFGKVWRDQPGVRDQLGWAIQPERMDSATIVDFARGRMVWLHGSDQIYVFSQNADIMTVGPRLK